MSKQRNILLAVGLVLVVVVAGILLWRSTEPKNAALGAGQQAMELLGERIAKLRPEYFAHPQSVILTRDDVAEIPKSQPKTLGC